MLTEIAPEFCMCFRSGTLVGLCGYRVDSSGVDRGNSCAVLAPRQPLDKSAIHTNDFHRAAEHSHEVLLCEAVEQKGIVLEGELLECRRCFMAKGLHKGIMQSTHTRGDNKIARVFEGLSGSRVVESTRKKRHALIVHDDFSRHTWVYFMSNKSQAAESFKPRSLWIHVQTVPLPRW